MQEYRAFIIREDGHIEDRVELRCQDDDEAKGQAEQLVDGRDVELWQRDRLIEIFKHVSQSDKTTP